MRNLPYSNNEKTLQWLEIHARKWGEDGASVGIEPAQAAELAALVEEARHAFAAASAARAAAHAATLHQNLTLEAARKKAAALVAVAKASIAVQDNPALYATAGIEPSPVGGPGRIGPPLQTPAQPRATVTASGVVHLSWTARQKARNVLYKVYRAVGNGPFTLIATVGRKHFADERTPPGAHPLTYLVRAQKGGRVSGASAATTVMPMGAMTPVGPEDSMPHSAAA